MRRRKIPGNGMGYFVAALYAFTALALTGELAAHRWGNVCLCVLTLMLFSLPGLLGRMLGITLPKALVLTILGFVFSSEILGEVCRWYLRFSWWDGLLHTLSGFFFCTAGWLIAGDIPLTDGRKNTRPWRSMVLGVCVSIAVGVIWELFEWSADLIFGLDMQKDTVLSGLRSLRLGEADGQGSIRGIREVAILCADGSCRYLGVGGYLDPGLHDTMGDLALGFLGAVVFSLIASGKGRAGKWLREHFIPRKSSRPGD